MGGETATAIKTVQSLLGEPVYARLATIDAPTGHPFVSLVAIAYSLNGAPMTLISSLAHHTRNLLADGQASLLIEAPTTPDTDLLTRARVYAGFSDFALWQMEIREAYLVAGFGKIHTLPGACLKD